MAPEDRLADVGQDRLVAPAAAHHLALTEDEVRPDLPGGGHGRAGLAPDQCGEPSGEVTLVGVRKCAVEPVRHRQAENAVAEKFEALVAAAPAAGLAGMGQRAGQQILIVEAVPDPLLQRAQRRTWLVGASPPGGSAGLGSVVQVRSGQWIVENRRDQRTWAGQFQTCHAGVPSSIEKKIISARPTKLAKGT